MSDEGSGVGSRGSEARYRWSSIIVEGADVQALNALAGVQCLNIHTDRTVTG